MPRSGTRRTLLRSPAALLEIIGDHSSALAAYRRAATAEGVVEPDVRCFLHRSLVSVGNLPAARLLADEVRRSAPADLGVYAMICETYEKAGDLRQAHRWLNLGLQVRHVPDAVHAELSRRAAAAGVPLSEYVLRVLERVAARPPVEEVLARSASRRLDLSLADVVDAIRAERPDR